MATTVDLYKTVKENFLKLIKESNPNTNITDVNSFSILGGGALTTPETVTIDGKDVVLDTYADIRGNPYYGFTGDVRFKYKRIDLTDLEAFQDTASIYRADTTTSRDVYDSINRSLGQESAWFSDSSSSLTTSTMVKKSVDDNVKDMIGGGIVVLNNWDINREPTYYESGQYYCNFVLTIHFYNINRYGVLRSFMKAGGNTPTIMRGCVEFGEDKVWFDSVSQPTTKFLYKGRYVAKIDYK